MAGALVISKHKGAQGGLVLVHGPDLGCHAFPPNQPPDLTATMSPKRYCFPIIDKRVGRPKTKDEGASSRTLLGFFTPASGHDIRKAFHFL
jgi:hypothetical protein